MDNKLKTVVSPSPHMRIYAGTRNIMLDVIIALMPALAFAVYVFGFRALAVTLVSVISCVLFELLYRKAMKKPSSVGDLSAVVTGILMAFCLPVTVPYWLPVIGAFFAIIVVKQLYGGIGKNFLNPALAGRAFLFSWPVLMTKWVAPFSYATIFNVFGPVDAIASATPMASLHAGLLPNVTVFQAFFGVVGGSLGEVSALMLLLGGAYLVFHKVISLRIPLAYILTVAIVTYAFPKGSADRLTWMLYNLFCGGLMLGAIFMATDYATSPVTKLGQIIFGTGCGLLTVFIRYFGTYPEAVSYAILIMNTTVWLLEKISFPRQFGVKPKFGLKGGAK